MKTEVKKDALIVHKLISQREEEGRNVDDVLSCVPSQMSPYLTRSISLVNHLQPFKNQGNLIFHEAVTR